MKIVRYDQVGTVEIRLVRRPTNTTVGVDNFTLYAHGFPVSPEPFVMRHLGTDEECANEAYDRALWAAVETFEVFA